VKIEKGYGMSGNQTSLLAKLLATENITVQQTPGIKTAMFDLKGRVLMLPLWQGISNDLQDLLIVHETGHALDTPDADTYKKAYEDITARIFPNEKISDQLKKTVQGFLNCVEDARIDKRQKRRYPGSRKNYLIGYKELMERDFFGTAKRDINTMNFIDRMNVYFKGGNINMNIEFSPEERVFLKRAEGLETFDEVVALTEEIYKFCKEKLEQQQEMEIDLVEGESEEGEGDDYSDFDGNDNRDTSDDDGEGQGQDEDETDSGESEEKANGVTQGEGDLEAESNKSGDGAGQNTEVPDNVPVSETDQTWQKRSQDIVKDENCHYIYLNMPQVNWDKAINDYKMVLEDWRKEMTTRYFDNDTFLACQKDMTQWKMKEKETISFLVKEFEAKKAAEMYARINIAKTGVIDTNKLHSYKYNDDIFRRLTVIPKGKNHGFIMFLDWSGSMQYNLRNTLKQLFSLCLFCKQIGVPFEVYAFRDCGADNPFTYMNQQNVIGGAPVVMRNFLSSRMNTQELNFAMSMLWYTSGRNYLGCDGLGGTPLNLAIMIAPKMVEDFRAKNKLEIVNTIFMTDGGSDSADGVKNETVPTTGMNNMQRSASRKYFYVDPVTRKTYDYEPWGWMGTQNNTNVLLRILKDRTGCNLVGFYLFERNFKRFMSDFNLWSYTDKDTKIKKFWQDNKFYPVQSAGYDEYYVIDSNAIGDNVNKLEIDNSGEKKMSPKRMAAAFSKFAMKKTVNRVLLRQFVDRIATQSKKVA
jgi:hypothetical protein